MPGCLIHTSNMLCTGNAWLDKFDDVIPKCNSIIAAYTTASYAF